MDNKVTKKRINDHLEYDWFKYLIILIVCIVGGYFIFSQIQSDKDYETFDMFISAYTSTDNNFAGEVSADMNSAAYAEKGENGAPSKADKYGENVLRSINFNIRDPLSKDYGTLLQTQGAQTSDVLIVGKSVMDGMGNGFLELTDELLNDYLLPQGLKIEDLEYFMADTEKNLLDENGNPVLNDKGENVKVQRRVGIRVDQFKRLHGTGSIVELDWRNVKTYNDTYKDKKEEEQPDSLFYLVINPKSVSIGKFNKKAKPQNAQALYCVNRFIQYYR